MNANGETDQEGEGKLISTAPPRWLLLWGPIPAEIEVVRGRMGREGSEVPWDVCLRSDYGSGRDEDRKCRGREMEVEFIVVYLEVGCDPCLRVPGMKYHVIWPNPGLTGLARRDYISRAIDSQDHRLTILSCSAPVCMLAAILTLSPMSKHEPRAQHAVRRQTPVPLPRISQGVL